MASSHEPLAIAASAGIVPESRSALMGAVCPEGDDNMAMSLRVKSLYSHTKRIWAPHHVVLRARHHQPGKFA